MKQMHDRGTASEDALDRYRRLMDGSQVGLFQTTPDGSVVWVNRAAARIAGYDSAAEFMSAITDIRQVYVDPTRRNDFEAELAQHGRVAGFRYEIRRKDGAIRWIEVGAQAVVGPDGSIEVFEGTLTDVTEEKLLEAALAAMSSQLDPTQAVSRFAGVLRRMIPYHQITLATIDGPYYRRMVSISAPGDLVSFPADEYVPLAGNSMLQVVTTRAPVVVSDTAAGRWEFDSVLNSRGVGAYAIFPLIDDSGVFATFNVGVAQPDSLTEDVVALLGSLTSAVANAVKNILVFEREREARRQLAEAARMKNEFLARASHDLRSPVSIVEGVTEILIGNWESMDESERRQRIGVIRRQASRMKDLLRRDLDVALIEAGELVCERHDFDLRSCVMEAVEDAAAAYPSMRFDVAIPDDLPSAYADEQRTVQVLANLLANAIKFSGNGTTIRVVVSEDRPLLRIDVEDEGPGIEREHLDEIFEKMSRLDGDTEGTGLGLYIARSLVELQGGHISVTSSPGKGSRFSFTVPAGS